MTYLKQNQTYDGAESSNKIDVLKNINKTFPNGLNFKELSLVEYESLIKGKKLNTTSPKPVGEGINSVSLPSGSTVGTAPIEGLNQSVGVSDISIKIAKLFSRYISFSGLSGGRLSYQLNNNINTSGLSDLGVNNRSYINSLTAARAIAFQSQNNKTNIRYENFQFKKATYNKFIFAMEKATNLLNLAFKSSGCLISKPLFTIAYKGSGSAAISKGIVGQNDSLSLKSNTSLSTDSKFKVNIHLFYYIKKEYKYNTNQGSFNVEKDNIFKYGQEGSKDYAAGNKGIYTNILSIGGLNYKLLYLSDYLTKLFNTDIEIELVRLYKPYQDSNILVQQLNTESYNKKFIKIISRLFKTINILPSNEMSEHNNSNINNILGSKPGNNVSFPSRISGLNIKLAGRTAKERVIPRLTVKRAQRGTLNRLNAKLIEKSMFTDKSRKGAFNFTVTLSHIFK